MKTVVSLTTPEDWYLAQELGADLIEIRLDMMSNEMQETMHSLCLQKSVPLIITMRSSDEGGSFSKSPEDWFAAIEPWLDCADYIDVEWRYASFASFIREKGIGIIASYHSNTMLSPGELQNFLEKLRSIGDIPKIVMTPRSHEDVLRLISFTLNSEKPLCTGVLGDSFRYARVMLPLFGSELVYCHAGAPTAPGQYHIKEMHTMLAMLS